MSALIHTVYIYNKERLKGAVVCKLTLDFTLSILFGVENTV